MYCGESSCGRMKVCFIPAEENSKMQVKADAIIVLWERYPSVAASNDVQVLSIWLGKVLQNFLGWTDEKTVDWAAQAESRMLPACLAAQSSMSPYNSFHEEITQPAELEIDCTL